MGPPMGLPMGFESQATVRATPFPRWGSAHAGKHTKHTPNTRQHTQLSHPQLYPSTELSRPQWVMLLSQAHGKPAMHKAQLEVHISSPTRRGDTEGRRAGENKFLTPCRTLPCTMHPGSPNKTLPCTMHPGSPNRTLPCTMHSGSKQWL